MPTPSVQQTYAESLRQRRLDDAEKWFNSFGEGSSTQAPKAPTPAPSAGAAPGGVSGDFKPRQPGEGKPTAPAPAQPAEQPGVLGEFGKGLAQGMTGLASATGVGLQVMGWLTGSKTMEEAGGEVSKWWDDYGKQFDSAEKGGVWDNPALLLKPTWWAHAIGSTVPSLAATLTPAGAGAKAAQIGAKAIQLTPAVTAKLARLGAAVSGGSVGGYLEGASTFKDLKAKGATDSEAAQGLLMMGFVAAALNALSLDSILKGGGKGLIGKAGRFLTSGTTEAVTEMAEEPSEAVIKWLLSKDPNASLSAAVVQGLKDSLNVGPAAFVTGGAAGAVMSGGKAPATPGASIPIPDAAGAPSQPASVSPSFAEGAARANDAVSRIEGLAGQQPHQGVPAPAPTTPLTPLDVETQLEGVSIKQAVDNGYATKQGDGFVWTEKGQKAVQFIQEAKTAGAPGAGGTLTPAPEGSTPSPAAIETPGEVLDQALRGNMEPVSQAVQRLQRLSPEAAAAYDFAQERNPDPTEPIGPEPEPATPSQQRQGRMSAEAAAAYEDARGRDVQPQESTTVDSGAADILAGNTQLLGVRQVPTDPLERAEFLLANGLEREAREGTYAPMAQAQQPQSVGSAAAVQDPRRAYHGTARVFRDFDTEMSSSEGNLGPGLYFTDDPKIASIHAEERAMSGRTVGDVAANVRPVSLFFTNPLRFDKTYQWEEIPTPIQAALQDIGYKPGSQIGENIWQTLARSKKYGKTRTNKLLQESGFDALENPYSYSGKHEWVVFDPTHVKPAFEGAGAAPASSFTPDAPLADTAIEPPVAPEVAGAGDTRAGHLTEDLRVNTTYLGGPESVKKLIQMANAANAPKQAQDRAAVPNDATVAAAKTALSLEQALNLPDLPLLNKDEATALRDHVQTFAQMQDEIITRIKRGTPEEQAEARQQLPLIAAIAQMLEYRRERASRVTARTLQAHKIVSEARRSETGISEDVLAQLAEQYGVPADFDIDAYIQAYDSLKSKAKRKRLLLGQTNGFWESVIGSVLWQVGTQVVNVGGNAYKATYAPIQREVAAIMDFGTNPSIAHGEGMQMYAAITRGWQRGLRLAGQAWRGEPFSETSGMEYDKWGLPRKPSITKENLFNGRFDEPGSTIGAAIDLYGHIVRLPLRGLAAVDGMARGIGFQMQAEALAYREAVLREGLEGEAAGRRVEELLDEISRGLHPELSARAQEFAKTQIFQGKIDGLMGTVQTGLNRASQQLPPLRMLWLFTQVPVATTQEALHHIPGLNFPYLAREVNVDLRHPIQGLRQGGEPQAAALATASLGLMMGATFSALAYAGLITGAGPADPERNAAWKLKHKPYSIKTPWGSWISYRRFEPLSLVMGWWADMAYFMGELDDDLALRSAVSLGYSTGRLMGERELLRGVAQLLDITSAYDEKRLKKLVQDIEHTLIPLVGAGTMLRKATDPEMKEMKGWFDGVVNSIPGWSKTLKPRVNRWGEDFHYEGGWGERMANPFYYSDVRQDKATDEVVRLVRANILPAPGKLQPVLQGTGLLPKAFNIEGGENPREGVPLDDEQFYWFQKWAGQHAKKEIDAYVKAPGYDKIDDREKGVEIAAHFETGVQEATAKVLERWPGLIPAWERRLEERYEKVYR